MNRQAMITEYAGVQAIHWGQRSEIGVKFVEFGRVRRGLSSATMGAAVRAALEQSRLARAEAAKLLTPAEALAEIEAGMPQVSQPPRHRLRAFVHVIADSASIVIIPFAVGRDGVLARTRLRFRLASGAGDRRLGRMVRLGVVVSRTLAAFNLRL